MVRNYIRSWNWVRLIRLIAGIWIIIEGVRTQEWPFVLLGGMLALMPVLNVGCGSSAGSCAVPRRKV